MKYFVKVEVASYVDKNKLHTFLKEKIATYDHTLITNEKEAFEFVQAVRNDWAFAHKMHSYCSIIDLDDSNASEFFPIEVNRNNSRVMGSYSIGWVKIHKVIVERGKADPHCPKCHGKIGNHQNFLHCTSCEASFEEVK